ncbi:hypothetical protein [Saccharicrinis fermentans]|nr:hypothetical protein [Saccharicrinis fermentans]
MNKLTTEEIQDIFERYFNKGKIETWKNKDYHNLSFLIQQKTKVIVSASTLKRIFGKLKTKENYTPQEATHLALEKYAISIRSEIINSRKLSISKNQIKIALISLCVILIGAGTYYIITHSSYKVSTIDTKLKLDRTEGKNTATVFFKLEGEDHKKNNYTIYFGDYMDTVQIPKKKSNIAHFYKYPGIFQPQIIKNNKVVKTLSKVTIPSDGWAAIGTARRMNQDNTIFPIDRDIIQKSNGYWHLNTSDMAKCGMDTTQISILRLLNYQDFGIDGDNFRLKMRIKNAGFWPQTNCNNIVVRVKCESGMIQQYFSKPGCSYWILARYSEIGKNGSQDDMSAFCVDLTDWGNVEIQNSDKQLNFIINDDVIYTQNYKRELGLIKGVEILFYGTGSIDDFELNSINGDISFKEDFNSVQ